MGRERTLAKLGFGMIILLVGQYLLGMYTNLFVTIPDGVNGWQWMSNSLAIMGHVTLGTLLLVVSVALLVFGARARSRTWIVASLVGLVGIGAALAGVFSTMINYTWWPTSGDGSWGTWASSTCCIRTRVACERGPSTRPTSRSGTAPSRST